MLAVEIKYAGFIVRATAPRLIGHQGFAPHVFVSRVDNTQIREECLMPWCPNGGYPCINDALNEAISYGVDAVDGKVQGFDKKTLM